MPRAAYGRRAGEAHLLVGAQHLDALHHLAPVPGGNYVALQGAAQEGSLGDGADVEQVLLPFAVHPFGTGLEPTVFVCVELLDVLAG